jgi:hypothetical protein
MYKYLSIYQKKKIWRLEKEFYIISKTFVNNQLEEWWFHEISRLDFRPWGGLNTEDYLSLDLNFKNFIKIFIKDFILIFFFFIKNILKPNYKKYLSKNVILIEDVVWNKKSVKNFFFKSIDQKIKKKKILILSFFHFNKKNAVTLSDITSSSEKFYYIFRSILSILIIFLQILKLKRKVKISNFWINFFFLKSSLKKIYLNFLIYNYAKNNKFCENLIFPYEEKTFERAVLSGIKDQQNINKLKTFAVCINPQHHLASFLKTFKGLNIPRSYRYLYCGKFYRTYFNKLDRENILSLNNKDCIGSAKSHIQYTKINIKNKSILLLLSHIDELKEIIFYLQTEKKLTNFKFILRPYPHAPTTYEIKNLINNSNINNILISNDKLINDIKKCGFVVFSGTSAGIECINLGRIGIWCNLSNVGINPLFDHVEFFFPSLNSKQFYKNLNLVYKMNNSAYKKKLKFQQKICQKIYSRINIKLINKYFNS